MLGVSLTNWKEDLKRIRTILPFWFRPGKKIKCGLVFEEVVVYVSLKQ